MRFFLDTSALVKIYHREEGSDYCLEHYRNQSNLVISELARVELHSAIYRKQQMKELNAKALRAVLQRFQYDCRERYEVLPVVSFVYDKACTLLSIHPPPNGLRTLDSLQLATFLTYCDRELDNFVCADKRLSMVADGEGIQTVLV